MMSSIIYKTQGTIDIKSGKYYVVPTLQEKIGQCVKALMEQKGWSTYEVARRSNNAITHATVWSVINNRVKEMKLSTLDAIAVALGVTATDLIDCAQSVTRRSGFQESDFARLYFKHSKVTDRVRRKEFERFWQMVERDYDRALLEEENKNKGEK